MEPLCTVPAGLAGAVSRTATAPIDRLKMLLQIQDGAQGLTLRGGLQKIAAEGERPRLHGVLSSSQIKGCLLLRAAGRLLPAGQVSSSKGRQQMPHTASAGPPALLPVVELHRTVMPADAWSQMQPSAEAHAAHVDNVRSALDAVPGACGPCAPWPQCLIGTGCLLQAC